MNITAISIQEFQYNCADVREQHQVLRFTQSNQNLSQSIIFTAIVHHSLSQLRRNSRIREMKIIKLFIQIRIGKGLNDQCSYIDDIKR